MAIGSFKNKATEDINYGNASKEALKLLPKKLHHKAQIKLARLGAATSMRNLKEISRDGYEAFKIVRGKSSFLAKFAKKLGIESA